MGVFTATAGRRLAIYLAFIVACASVLVFMPLDPARANHPGGSFDGLDGQLDPGAVNLTDVCGTGGDDILRNGSNYKLNVVHNTPTPPSVVILGNAANKADICDIWLATETVGDDVFLYLAWDRASTTGSTVFAFEFHQSGLTCIADPANPNDTCNPFAGRQAGDFLITYDFQGQNIDIGMRTFNGTSFGPLIPVADADFEASLSGDSSFGEAVINLTGNPPIIPPDPQECLTVANIIPMTITGNSDSAEVMDIVIDDFSDEIGISNCGQLDVHKVTVPAGLSGTFDITVDGSRLTSPLNGTLTGDGDSETFIDLFVATDYSLTETVPAGWLSNYTVACQLEDGTPTGAGTNIEININETTTCVITNTAIPPQLTLIKTVVNDNGGTAGPADWTLTATGPEVLTGPSGVSGEVAIGTYNLSESGPAGYANLGWVCVGDGTQNGAAITLGPGDVATCTVTNDDITPHLTLVKVVDNDAGGTAVAADWTLSAAGPTPISGPGGADADVNAGTYTLSETGGPSGYEASTWTCVGGTQNGDQVTLALGESATCTITNSDIAPILTLEKVVINDDGGDELDTAWTLTASGPVTASGVEGDAAITNAAVVAGTYALSESGPAGYEASAWQCDGGTLNGADLTLALGDVVTCTITNDDIAPTLTVVKTVINDNGGDAVVADFPLFLNGGAVTSGVANTLSANTAYTVSETQQSGYTLTSIVCDNGQANAGPTIDVTLAPGENVTCTITNDDDAPGLTVVKNVVNDDGGTAVVADFPLFVNGDPVTSGVQIDAAANVAYTISETQLDGYELTGISCTNGQSNAGPDITVTLSEGEFVTCTITNNDIAPTLTVVKAVTNDDGGLGIPSDFTLFITPDGGSAQVVASGASNDVTANLAYTVTESTVPGYEMTSLVCTDNDTAEPLSHPVSLAPGQNATCVVTNDDIPATLTLVKVLITDDGGDEVATDWTLSAAGPTPISGPTGDPAVTGAEVNAGTYTLSESGPAGYEASAWQCDGGTLNGDQLTLALAESATCTITNDDIAPTITVIKQVVNDDGGDAVVADFALFLNGDPVTSGVTYTVAGNATYTVTETQIDGYALTSLVCEDDQGQVTHPVELGLDTDVTCVLINDDLAPGLTVFKQVVNDDGGDAVIADFPLFIDDGEGAVEVTHGVGNDVLANVAYTISETQLDGYELTGIACTNGQSSDGPTISVTLSEGEAVGCTITNDDVAPTITVVKDVVNDQGGDAGGDDFALFLDDGNGPTEVVNGAVNVVLANGTYTVSETLLEGYEQTNLACFDNETEEPVAHPVETVEGQNVTCVITNDDLPPTLTVVVVVETGDALPDDFDPTIEGDIPGVGNSVLDVLSGEVVELFSNTPYTTGITLVDGYVQTGFVCTDDDTAADVAHPVTLSPDQGVTCVYTVNELGSITVVKQAVPGGGEFDFTLDPGDTQTVSGDGGTYTWADLEPGSYDLTEATSVDWSLEEVTCDATVDPLDTGASIAIDYGVHVTCVFTNGQAPLLTVVKVTTLDSDAQFPFTVGDAAFDLTNGESETLVLTEGTHSVTEAVPVGWRLDSVVCDAPATDIENGVSLDLAFGDEVTCTFTNTELADVAVTKVDVEDPIFLNEEVPVGTIIYTLEVTNNGPGDATGVTVVDTLAPETTFDTATPSQGTCSHAGGVVTCELGDLAAGASASITITVLTEDIETISSFLVTNTVTVSADQEDTDPSNNTDVEETVIVAVLPLPPITPPPPQVLPETGLATEELALLATGLIALGVFLVAIRRKEEDELG